MAALHFDRVTASVPDVFKSDFLYFYDYDRSWPNVGKVTPSGRTLELLYYEYTCKLEIDVVKTLRENMTWSVNYASEKQEPILFQAVRSSNTDLTVIKFLLEKGANLHIALEFQDSGSIGTYGIFYCLLN